MIFKGELHNVKLINFSVDAEEIIGHIPKGLPVLIEDEKAIISMVDVELKNMHLFWFPFLKFNYRHVAFRVLLEDEHLNGLNENKGIFFLKSFSENRLLNFFGNRIANYRLSTMKFNSITRGLRINKGNELIEYQLDFDSTIDKDNDLYRKIHRIDRAYHTDNKDIYVTQITREKWPIKPVSCINFNTNLFQTAKLLGAFYVNEVIYYIWNNPRKLKP